MSDVADYFSGEAEGWSRRYGLSRAFRERLATVLGWLRDSPADTSLLDFGCGSGVFASALVRRGFDVTAVDPAEGMLSQARPALEEAAEAARAEGHAGHFELERLEVGDASFWSREPFEVVLALGVLEYLEDGVEVACRLAGLVRPGGRLILSLPNRRSVLRGVEGFAFRHPALFRALGLLPHVTREGCYLEHQKQQFLPAEMDAALKDAGMCREHLHHHAAPALLGPFAHGALFGMTFQVSYRRDGERSSLSPDDA